MSSRFQAVPGRTVSRWTSSCLRVSPRGGNCGAHAQHDQRLFWANLIGVIRHPNPIVGRFDGFPQGRHAHPQKPSANRRPGRKRLLHPKPFPHDRQNPFGGTQADDPRKFTARRIMRRPNLCPFSRGSAGKLTLVAASL